MAGRTGRRRAVLLFAVLAGLFLMHGLSAPDTHGMPISMQAPIQAPMQAPAPVSAHTESVTPPQATAVSCPDTMSDHMQASMTCIPLRPEGLAGLFLALFLLVITPWWLGVSLPVRLIHLRWPNGPPRSGVQILHTLSISRT